jgi:hypothetical protein
MRGQKGASDAKDIPASLSEKKAITESLYRYHAEYDRIISLFMFLIDIAHRVDSMKEYASQVLAAVDTGKPAPTYEEVSKGLNFGEAGASKFVKKNAGLLSRFLVCNSVENLLCYLSDILKAVIQKRPQLLFSSEQIKVEEVLRHGSMKKLISYLVDQKVMDLSYMGIKDLSKYLSDRLGIVLADTETARDDLSLFVEIRNIHVHNRGVVNATFLTRLKGISTAKLGKVYHVSFDEFVKLNNNLFSLAVQLDEEVSSKFSLKKKRLSAWKAGQKDNL